MFLSFGSGTSDLENVLLSMVSGGGGGGEPFARVLLDLTPPEVKEQLSGTSKRSEVWLSGTPKRSEIWLTWTPKKSEIWLSIKSHSLGNPILQAHHGKSDIW